MSYTKTTWTSSTNITTTLLNHAETQFDEAYAVYSGHNHDSTHYTRSQSDNIFWNNDNDGDGSGMDADLIYHPSGNKHASDLSGASVASGIIIMWSGSSIPPGWILCDGTGGTPDLRGRFVVGAGNSYNPGATGRPTPAGTEIYHVKPNASVSIGYHALTLAEITHTHTVTDYHGGGGSMGYGSGSIATGNTYIERNTGSSCGNASGNADAHTHSATFTGNDCDVRPPYYVLAFIMKS